MRLITARLAEARAATAVVRTVSYRLGPTGETRSVWWRIEGDEAVLPSPLRRHDIAAVALVYLAMRERAGLHIEGPVSRSLLENLEEFTGAWSCWLPDLYGNVEITADEEVPDDTPLATGRAVVAFSGGVDGSFTLWRHARGKAGRRSRAVAHAVLIHGMDMPLELADVFAPVIETARKTVGSLGLPLALVRTNWRAEISRLYRMEYGAGIASTLLNWSGDLDTALMGAAEDYPRVALPWGANPLTQPMLTSAAMRLVLDGSEYMRTEKVRMLLQWPEAIENLRVCWEGPKSAGNCGRCEKCLRTKLNFMALGAALPRSLAGEPTPAQLLTLRANAPTKISFLQDILETARKEDTWGPWARYVQVALARNRAQNLVLGTLRRALARARRLAPSRPALPSTTGSLSPPGAAAH